MRMANTVLHWETSVGSICAGRCVTRPRKTPYLRPSLAMRDERLARRLEADRAVGIGVVVRLLADHQQRHGAVAPQAELEREAEQHRDDGVEHLGRETGELHDGHRLAVAFEPQQLAQDIDHRVAADVRRHRR